MNKRNKFSSWIFSIYLLLAFYVFGGGMVTSLVGYQIWKLVGQDEFPKFHQADNLLIIRVFVIFFFLSFVPPNSVVLVSPCGYTQMDVGISFAAKFDHVDFIHNNSNPDSNQT